MQNYDGKTIDRYQLLAPLGQGGMAVVYRAVDLDLNREVAVKLIRKDAIPPRLLGKTLQRFEVEAKALANLSHPNIVPVFDYGTVDEEPYIVMEYLPGGTLAERMAKVMGYREALSLLIPIADALAYAHGKGIVHRDVKPCNILLTKDGIPMLSDFGIAKVFNDETNANLTTTGVGIGTPGYMAPEQWYGQVTPAVDQYALGIMLYEMVTGQRPYSAESSRSLAHMQLIGSMTRARDYQPAIPVAVDSAMSKLLSADPKGRYPDMSACKHTLEELTQESEPVRRISRVRTAVIGGVLALALLTFMFLSLNPDRQKTARGAIMRTSTAVVVAQALTVDSQVTETIRALSKTPDVTEDPLFATVSANATENAKKPTRTPTATIEVPLFTGSTALPELSFLDQYQVVFSNLLIDRQRALDPQEWNWWNVGFGDLAIANGTLAFKLNEIFPGIGRASYTIMDGVGALTLVQVAPGTHGVIMADKGKFDTTFYTTWESYLNYGEALKCAMYPYVGPLAAETIADQWYYVYFEPRGTEGYVRMWEYGHPENFAECSMLIPEGGNWRWNFTGTEGTMYIKGYWEIKTQ